MRIRPRLIRSMGRSFRKGRGIWSFRRRMAMRTPLAISRLPNNTNSHNNMPNKKLQPNIK
jgi:hypothetical protein